MADAGRPGGPTAEVAFGALAVALFCGIVAWTAGVVTGADVDLDLGNLWLLVPVCLLLLLLLVLVTSQAIPLPVRAVLLGGVAGVTLAVTTAEASLATRSLVTIAAWALIVAYLAREWARTWLRITVAVIAVSALVLTVMVGRGEIKETRADEARAAATRLDRTRADLRDAADAELEAAEEAAGDAMTKAAGAVARAVGAVPPGDGTAPRCPPARVPADELLCEALALLDSDVAAAKERTATARQASAADLALRDRVADVEAAIEAAESVTRKRAGGAVIDDKESAAATATTDLCTAAAGTRSGEDMAAYLPCIKVEGRTPEGTDDVADALARAEVAVADLAVAVKGRADGRGEALEKAEATLAAAESSEAEGEKAEFADLVREGGGAIVSAVPVVGARDVPIALAVLGWAALGALALLGYRRLEIANAGIARGAVSFGPLAQDAADQEGGGDGEKELQPVFRRYVLENVAEPGALPGTSSSAALSSLTEVSSDPRTKLVGALLKLFQEATASTSGYLVDATYHTHPALGAATEDEEIEHEVFARLRDARTGATLAQRASPAATRELALRTAGYWAAAAVLERDRRSPSWASWTASSSGALAAYDEARRRGEGSKEKLEQAAREAVTSGLLLLRLANEKDIEGKHIEALELLLRAGTVHPRYPQARYRLAVSFSMTAGTYETTWGQATVATRRRVVAMTERCAAACAITTIAKPLKKLKPGGSTPANSREALLDIADAFRKSTCELLAWGSIARNSLRRSERAVWLDMIVREVGRTWRNQTCEALGAAELAIVASRYGTLHDAVAARFTAWQALYNVACAYAITAAAGGVEPRHRAVAYLARVIEAPGGAQVSREWLLADPDLAAIRGDDGFREICNRVRERETIEEVVT